MESYDADDLQSVLTYIRERFGEAIFEDPLRIYGVISDLSPKLKSARNILRHLSEAGLCAELRRAVKRGESGQCSRVLLKSRYWLIENLDLSEDRAEYYAAALQAAYGLGASTTLKPQTTPVPQAAPKPQSTQKPQAAPKPPGIVIDSGRTGACAWELDGNGVLTISGAGPMENYVFPDKPEWWYNADRIQSLIMRGGVTNIGDYAFFGCDKLAAADIPDSVTSIGNSAFKGCGALTAVAIPDGVTNIGNAAFEGCRSLTAVAIPDGVTAIGNAAFADCASLTGVDIPDSVASVGDYAFWGCGRLTSVSVPENATIHAGAFDWRVKVTPRIPDGAPEWTPIQS